MENSVSKSILILRVMKRIQRSAQDKKNGGKYLYEIVGGYPLPQEKTEKKIAKMLSRRIVFRKARWDIYRIGTDMTSWNSTDHVILGKLRIRRTSYIS